MVALGRPDAAGIVVAPSGEFDLIYCLLSILPPQYNFYRRSRLTILTKIYHVCANISI